jgi:hypothetical protein
MLSRFGISVFGRSGGFSKDGITFGIITVSAIQAWNMASERNGLCATFEWCAQLSFFTREYATGVCEISESC